MKIISEEKIAELIVLINNHQTLKVRKELLSLEDSKEFTNPVEQDTNKNNPN
jgi:hypothetical protein